MHRSITVGFLLAFLPLATLAVPAAAQCDGTWTTGAGSIGAVGFPNAVRALATSPNGTIFAGGTFGTAGGGAASNVAGWNGSSWSALGSGLSSTVYALAVTPNLDLIAGGQFTFSGVTSVSRIARWNGTTWSALGTGTDGTVYALATAPNGDVYAGGSFTTPGTNIARWNGSAWSALGSGLNARVEALVVMPNGDLIAGGQFMGSGVTPVSRIARWDGSTWSAMGSGIDGTVSGLTVTPSGDLIACGLFGQAGAITSAISVARWNSAGGAGGTWYKMGPGLVSNVYAVRALPNGSVIAVGAGPTTALGTPVTVNYVSRWDGTTWQPIDSGVGAFVRAVTHGIGVNGDFYIGGDFLTAGSAAATAVRIAQGRVPAPPPVIDSQTGAMTAFCGSTARFSVSASSATTFFGYQWRRNTVNLADGVTPGGSTISGATSAHLNIADVGASDAGDYDCVLTNIGTTTCSSQTTPSTLTVTHCCAPDFNNSGVLEVADIFQFLNSWFAGCP